MPPSSSATQSDAPSDTPWPRLHPDAPLYVVLNPGSGKLDTHERIDTVRAVLHEAGRRFVVARVAHPRELIAEGHHAIAWAQEHNGAVVAAGGDGTINALAGLVLPTQLPFGVLPQGTFNYTARAYGIPSDDIETSTRSLLNARVRPIQVGMCNERIFLVNGSMGLYPQALEDREHFKQRLGRSRPVAALAALFTVFGPRRDWVIKVEVDGHETTIVTPTLFVGNNALQLAQLGIDGDAAQGDGKLVAITTQPIGRAAMLRLLLRGAVGQLADAEEVSSVAFNRLTLAPRLPHRPRRIKVATDGEICWMHTPLRFQTAPQRLRLLVPDQPTPETA